MTIDVSAMQSFTSAEFLTMAEHGIAHLLAGGQSYTLNGRQFVRAQLGELKDIRDAFKREVAESGSVTGSLTALAVFGQQQ